MYTRASLTYTSPREEKRACRTSRQTSRRGSSCVFGSWQTERGTARAAARQLPREDPRVGEDVRVAVGVGVRVGPMEFQLNNAQRTNIPRYGVDVPRPVDLAV